MLKEGIAEFIHGANDYYHDEILDIADGNWDNSKLHQAGYIAWHFMATASGRTATEAVQTFVDILRSGSGNITEERFDNAISVTTKGRFKTADELEAGIEAAIQGAADATSFLLSIGIDLDSGDTGAIIGSGASGHAVQNASDIVLEGGSTKRWVNPTSDTSIINGLTVHWPSEITDDTGAGTGVLIPRITQGTSFQVGTKAAQTINVAMAYIDAKGVGLQANDGTNASISTKWKATQTIDLIDRSINHVLGLHTSVGSVMSRLEYTSANLVTQSENVTSAESNIRDSDMAKEMTEYTKNNVLMQAAQSMLSQANQNSSNALSLLQ